jgi:PBP1b-binding outer membrane lipoprotein LpoB
MNRALLIALAALLMTMGCSKANSPVENQESAQKGTDKPQSPAELPKYHVTKKKTCQTASQSTRCYSVSTDATSEEDLTAFTQHFRKQSGDVIAVVATFFFDKPQANSSGRASLLRYSLTSPRLTLAVGASLSIARRMPATSCRDLSRKMPT